MDKSILDLSTEHRQKAYEISFIRNSFISSSVKWLINNPNEDFESKFDAMRINCFGRDGADEVDFNHISCGRLLLDCKTQIKSLYESQVAWDAGL